MIQRCLFGLACLATAGTAFAQGSLPTSQPNFVTIIREEVKIGRTSEHAKIEAGWPAAFEKAKSPDYYLAAVSVTGKPEAWFIVASDSHKAMEATMKREDTDPLLSVELPRLSRLDADVLTGWTLMQGMARKDLSYGSFPDVGKIRFYEITTFQVKPGHEQQFEAAAKAYGSAAKRRVPNHSYRVYEMIAGTPSPTYVVFASVESFGQFDQLMEEGQAIMKGATEEEGRALQGLMAEGVISVETQRFRIDPTMSYVPKEVRASDPAFWMPKKKPAAKAPTSN
jgi:hypothetical protein